MYNSPWDVLEINKNYCRRDPKERPTIVGVLRSGKEVVGVPRWIYSRHI
jgi:hypothetical protein